MTFHPQILVLGALINCVELSESARNCEAMASLAVRWSAAGWRVEAAATTGPSPIKAASRCTAPKFLARLLMACTEGFAKHLEVDGHEHEADARDNTMSSLSPSVMPPVSEGQGAEQPTGDNGSSLLAGGSGEDAGARAGLSVVGGEVEEAMSASEGAQLVLGGHCALLLGLLVREHTDNRCERSSHRVSDPRAQLRLCH